MVRFGGKFNTSNLLATIHVLSSSCLFVHPPLPRHSFLDITTNFEKVSQRYTSGEQIVDINYSHNIS